MLKKTKRIILRIGLCITEDKVVQNAHIDFNIKEEHINQIDNSQDNTKKHKQNKKPNRIKPKNYSFIQKLIFFIFILLCFIGLFIFAIFQIKKMREQKKETEEKAFLVDFCKNDQSCLDQVRRKGEDIHNLNLYVKFDEIPEYKKKIIRDLSFCKQDKENFLVIIKDELADYYVYIFYPDQQQMTIIHSKNYCKYNGLQAPREQIFIFNIFLEEQQNIFQDIVGEVLTVQNVLLKKTQIFLVKRGSVQYLERRLKRQKETAGVWDFHFSHFLHTFLRFFSEQNLQEKLQNLKENYLFLFNDENLLFTSKKEIEIDENSLLNFEKYGENNIFFFIKNFEDSPRDFKYFFCFFKGEEFVTTMTNMEVNEIQFEEDSKLTPDDRLYLNELFKKVKEKENWFEQKQKEKIKNFFEKTKGLFDKAIKRCEDRYLQAEIMPTSDFLEIFLTDKDLETK